VTVRVRRVHSRAAEGPLLKVHRRHVDKHARTAIAARRGCAPEDVALWSGRDDGYGAVLLYIEDADDTTAARKALQAHGYNVRVDDTEVGPFLRVTAGERTERVPEDVVLGYLRYTQVADALREEILARQYPRVFPAQTALMERFEASLSTISRACKILAAEGLIEPQPGAGTVVAAKYRAPAPSRRKRDSSR
jgi:hypothetical protein